MKFAVLTCGMLPIPAVQGGAVENMIGFYLEYNNRKMLHDITVYSPWNSKVAKHPALSSDVNHYIFIDVTSLKAKISRKIYSYCHSNNYYNYFIEFYFEQVYKDLKKKDYDLIVLENCPGYVYKLAQRGHKNVILHLNNDLLNSNSRFHNVIFNGLEKILTCSNYIKGRVSTIAVSNKIHTLYNAIDVQSFTPKEQSTVSRKDISLTDDDFVIVYSGRINKDKGVSELIESMLLLKDIPRLKLMIIGGTFYGNSANEDDFVASLKIKAKSLEDRIIFTGYVPYENIPKYLHMANIAVLPSMWDEPFGLTIAEALATGLPLITTRSGGIPEICEGVATILDREHIVDNLANAILDLYHHPEKRKLMAKASMERAQQFDKETYAKNFFDALENL